LYTNNEILHFYIYIEITIDEYSQWLNCKKRARGTLKIKICLIGQCKGEIWGKWRFSGGTLAGTGGTPFHSVSPLFKHWIEHSYIYLYIYFNGYKNVVHMYSIVYYMNQWGVMCVWCKAEKCLVILRSETDAAIPCWLLINRWHTNWHLWHILACRVIADTWGVLYSNTAPSQYLYWTINVWHSV
jgi:hypothetical protein